jgi:hypothetical protein
VPGWPFLPWEGLEGGPLVCLGGVQVEEGPAVVRAARGIAQIGVQPPMQTISKGKS